MLKGKNVFSSPWPIRLLISNLIEEEKNHFNGGLYSGRRRSIRGDSISASILQPKTKLPPTSNDEHVSSPRKRKIDVANSDEEGSSAKESHQSNQSYDALAMVVKETRNFRWSFTRSVKKVTDHVNEDHERWQDQPNFIEFYLKQVEDEIGTINGLLAGFAQ